MTKDIEGKVRQLKCPTCKKKLLPTKPNGHLYAGVAIGKYQGEEYVMFCSIKCRENVKENM